MKHQSPVTGHWSRICGVLAALVLGASPAPAADDNFKDGGPYVPTPHQVVGAMLDLAKVGPRDFVVDLGSGDGRIVITAAARYKARGMGVDIDGELVSLANASARKQEVADRVQFFQKDVFAADLGSATVLTLYLLPEMMDRLRPKLLKELKPGTRIVSHDFSLGDWKPDRTIEVSTPEKYDVTGSFTSTLHLWVVPAAVDGAWADDRGVFRLELKQSFQRIEGAYIRGGRREKLTGDVAGDLIRFTVPGKRGRSERFTGTVNGGRITGEVRSTDGELLARWGAARIPY